MKGALRVRVHVMRQADAEKPFAFKWGRQTYIRNDEHGVVSRAEIDWSEALQVKLEALAHGEPSAQVQAELGELLGDFLRDIGVLEGLGGAAKGGGAVDEDSEEARIGVALEQQQRVIISVRLNAAELYSLPWELAKVAEDGVPLGAREGLLLRYAWPGTATVEHAVRPRPEGGGLLFAWAAPREDVPVQPHQAALHAAWDAGVGAETAQMSVLPDATLEGIIGRLEAAQAAGTPITMLHLLCHGVLWKETAHLLLGAPGEEVLLDAQTLASGLQPFAGTLRLVVLCACKSGDAPNPSMRLPGVAQALHRAGLQSVVASRLPLSKMGSVVLATALWRTLLVEIGSLEEGVLAAQRALLAQRKGLDWAALQLYAREEDGDDTRPFTFRPYRGLLAFGPRHHRFFHGRSHETTELLEDLAALRREGRPRFVVVAGASGTGKSSLVLSSVCSALSGSSGGDAAPEAPTEPGSDAAATSKKLLEMLGQLGTLAGVLPGDVYREVSVGLSRALAMLQADGQRWEVITFRPGSKPMQALGRALARRSGKGPLLLVVDQLEELFHEAIPSAERQQFGRELWQRAQDAEGTCVVVTIRVDDLAYCSELELDSAGTRLDRVAYDERHRVFVAQMTLEQLKEVIHLPAERVGLRLQESLGQRILADLGGQVGSLPLLAHAMDLLWQQRVDGELTFAAYEAMEGVGGALKQVADRLLDSLAPEQLELARYVLVRLVAADGQHRQRAALADIRPSDEDEGRRFDEVVQRLCDARLVYRSDQGGEVTLELAHEALIRRWKRLRGWLREDQGMLAQLEEVERWAKIHAEHGEDLEVRRLAIAQAVDQRFPGRLTDEARKMIADSERGMQRQRRGLYSFVGFILLLGAGFTALMAVGFVLSANDAQRARDVIFLSEAVKREGEARELDKAPQGGGAAAQALREQATSILLDVGLTAGTRGWDTLATSVLAPTLRQRTLQCAAVTEAACASGDCPQEDAAPGCQTPCWSTITAVAFGEAPGELLFGDAFGAVYRVDLQDERACAARLLAPTSGPVHAVQASPGGAGAAVVRGNQLVFIDFTEDQDATSTIELGATGTPWMGFEKGGDAALLVAGAEPPSLRRCSPSGCEALTPAGVEGRWEVKDLHAPSGRLLVLGPLCPTAAEGSEAPCDDLEAQAEVWVSGERHVIPVGVRPVDGALGQPPYVALSAAPDGIEGDLETAGVIGKMLAFGMRSSFLCTESACDEVYVRSHLLAAVAEDVVFSPDGRRFAEHGRGDEGALRVRDLDGDVALFLPAQSPDPLELVHGLKGAQHGEVTFSGDGQRIAALYPSSIPGGVVLRVWDIDARPPGYAFELKNPEAPDYSQVRLDHEGRWAVVLEGDRTLVARELGERSLWLQLDQQPHSCLSVDTYALLGTPAFRARARRCGCLSKLVEDGDLGYTEAGAAGEVLHLRQLMDEAECASWATRIGGRVEDMRSRDFDYEFRKRPDG